MSTIRCTLVAPPVDFFHALYGFESGPAHRNQPPLGIGYIAAALRQEGIAVRLHDAAAQGWDTEETVRRILEDAPDIIGITAITFEAPGAYELARALRPQTDALLVLGGAHANSNYPSVPDECPELDVVVAGDGEPILTEICHAVAEGTDLEAVRGTRVKRSDGSFSEFRPHPGIADLDTLPTPAYELYPLDLYKPLPHRQRRLPSASVIASRGCSYGRCTYCELSGLLPRTYRCHSPARVVEDIKRIVYLTGARDIYFQDDIFVVEEAWVYELCDRLRHADLDLVWSCESRFDNFTPSLLSAMREAGCWRIYLGLETGSAELLRRIKKGFDPEAAREAVTMVRKAGIEVVGFFMLGLPGETPELGRETIEYSLGLGLAHALFSLTVPSRNTELYGICRDAGTLSSQDYNYKRASFVPSGYRDAAQLEALREEAMRRFYLRPSYWWQCLRDIRSRDDLLYYARGLQALLGYMG